MQPPGPLPADADNRRPGRLANTFIVVFLVAQVALPVRYYLRPEDDRQDERFAWRMFSSLGRRTCDVEVIDVRPGQASEDATGKTLGKSAPLRRDYQGTWFTLLQKMRPLVVEKVLRTRCRSDERLMYVDYHRRCTTTAGVEVEPDHVRMHCDDERLETLSGAGG